MYSSTRKSSRGVLRISGVLLALALSSRLGADVVSLPTFNVNIDETSVSGLSSGAYMAVQFQVAHSSVVKGAGVIAGGPYFCAQDSQDTATTVCSCTGFLGCRPSQAAALVPSLVSATDQNASVGAIDPTSNLADDRVWMFSGSLDSVVPQPVMDALETYYQNYLSVANISYEKGVPSEHAMPTETYGNPCGFKGEPFINDCDFDAAGELLKWIYGELNSKNTATLSGSFIEFAQNEFIANPESHGMWPTGWAYVPASCQDGAPCRVHVVFHGCKQYPDAFFPGGPGGKMRDTYVKNAGYNEWADTNNVIILYPQANAMLVGTRLPRINPFGCWDWWGYDDRHYAMTSGPQIAAVKAMLGRLAGVTPPPPNGAYCGSATNAEHVLAGRAYTWFFWLYFAHGSNAYLGWSGLSQTTLEETSPGFYDVKVP